MTIPFQVIAPLYRANMQDGVRVFINQGGTSSGKTYTIMEVLFVLAITERGVVITVCGQDLPNLKVGALRDAKTIIGKSEWMQKYFQVHEGASTITALNGSLIEFKSYENPQDAKSGKRDYLFVNEANGIPYDVYWQLAIRTRKRIWIDYNPSARFWVHDELINREGTKLIISDHRGNPFLSEDEHERIENITDPDLWKVYARGMTGKLSGVVLTRWDIVDQLPPKNEWKQHGYGLDFGFSQDPTALEHVVLAHGDLWVDEVIYTTGLVNPDIARLAKREGVTRSDIIVADSAEPKSIREIHNEGLWVVPSPKGSDGITVGIDILRRYQIHFTRRSVGIIENAKSYMWRKDRDGKRTNTPEDGNDHGIDAIRYYALMKLNTRRNTGGSKITVSKL